MSVDANAKSLKMRREAELAGSGNSHKLGDGHTEGLDFDFKRANVSKHIDLGEEVAHKYVDTRNEGAARAHEVHHHNKSDHFHDDDEYDEEDELIEEDEKDLVDDISATESSRRRRGLSDCYNGSPRRRGLAKGANRRREESRRRMCLHQNNCTTTAAAVCTPERIPNSGDLWGDDYCYCPLIQGHGNKQCIQCQCLNCTSDDSDSDTDGIVGKHSKSSKRGSAPSSSLTLPFVLLWLLILSLAA